MTKIEKIDKVRKVSKSIESFRNIVQKNAAQAPPNKEYFNALMQNKGDVKIDPYKEQHGAVRSKPSLLDEIANVNRKVESLSKYSTSDLIAQAKTAVDKIDGLKEKLSTPELRIKSSVQRLLKNKLDDINENLKIAFAKAGVEYIPPDERLGGVNPIVKFLDMLAHGQDQLEGLSGHIQGLVDKEEDINPADLLAVQIKVNSIVQELEFFSNLLNKALESTKTLMNIQV